MINSLKAHAWKIVAFCFIACIQLVPVKSYAGEPANTAALQLVKRLMPQLASQFVFEQIITPGDSDAYELESKDGKIVIRGNNANSMAVGLNHYLKYYCNVSVSWWREDKLNLPAQLPAIKGKVKQTARCKNRFFLNYCTFGYTMPWWKWNDWQWFIDWMALNGVNMPLAITGEEAIWYNVWHKLGLSDAQIRGFFTGPAYLPWHRMANIDHWQGPLPMSWIKEQLVLQQQILKRERELGMKPVLPAFAGHVPEILKEKYPLAKITSLGEWGSFDKKYRSYFLDPFDPLFNKIQKEFLAQQTKLFGTDHIYGTDPFNEVTPPSWEPDYLASVSKTIYSSMQASDPKAQWLQMAWIFYNGRDNWTNTRIEAYLKAVPQDKMILLDYYCDKTEIWKITDKFFGQPYLWCYLGNFGSNSMLTGNLNDVESRMENTFENGGKNMWGIGSTTEGFGVNPIAYEYVFEKAWANGPVNTAKWVDDWAMRRRGMYDKNAEEAWNIMNKKVLIQVGVLGGAELTDARPSLTGHTSWTTNPQIDYDNRDLLKVWGLLNHPSGNNLPDVYKYDVVNIGRQVLGNYFFMVRDRFTAAYKKHDLKRMDTEGKEMIDIIHDMDALMATQSSFLLGKWIKDARAMGINATEKNYFENDARTILTTWGQQGSNLTDYANRNLSGLMNDYYGKRWEMFIADVELSAKANQPFDEKAFDAESKAFEWGWTKKRNQFSAIPTGDSMVISKALFDKYATEIAATLPE
jgi:alpha-N-acetylglucosaminidase